MGRKKKVVVEVLKCEDNCSAYFSLRGNSISSLCMHPCSAVAVIKKDQPVCDIYYRELRVDACIKEIEENLKNAP